MEKPRCVLQDGIWWCPWHNGRPKITLDTYPVLCGECYPKWLKEKEIERRDVNGNKTKT